MSYTVRAAHFANPVKMTGRTDLGVCPKNFKTLETALKLGVPSLVKMKDGKNFVVILGPNGECHHRTI